MSRLLLSILLTLILGGLAAAGTVNNPSVYEGNNVTITYDFGYSAPADGLEVRVETANGSATRDVDFSITANQLGYRSVTFGSTSISITATTVDEGVVEGSEVFPVAFMENVSSDPGFDNGASNWVGATITTQPLVDLTSLSPPMGNNVLHIKDKEVPYRDFTLQTGEDYTLELEWSEASGDGAGNACDDSSVYPGFVNFADTLRFEVEDLGGTSSVPWTTLYDDPSNVGLAQYSGDENFNFSGESATFTWTGSGTARLKLSVLDASGRQYEGYCGFVVDDFRLNKQMVQATVTINDPDPAPTVSSVSVPADNTYAAGDNLNFTVNASENVTVSGTPQLVLTIGSTSRQADYVSGSGTSALVFRYTVQSGDLDTDGIVVSSLSANGGTLRDSANNDMSLALNSVGNTSSVTVNINVSALTVNISSSDVENGSSSSLNSVTVAFVTSENTTDFGLSDISVTNAVVSSFSGSNSNYTAVITPISNGAVSLLVASGTFTGSLSQANIASSIYMWIYDPNLALVDAAVTDAQTIIAKQVTTQGKSLLTASQNLIQTSIDHLLVRTQLQAQRRERSGTQTASQQQSPEETADHTPSSSFNKQGTFADRLADAIKLLDVDVDDFGYSGALNFDLYEPLSGRNTALITKVKASVSDQDNGPETTNITASYALEFDSDDRKMIYARFLHLTKSKSDFRFEHSGTQDSKGISAGIYSIYSPRVDHLVTIFGSLGIAQTDLALKTASARINDSYNSLNLQTGVTLSQTYHHDRMIFVWEMAAEALYSRQRSRYANILIGSTNYPARVDASVVKDIIATFTPKFIFDLKDTEGEMPSNLQFSPSVRCGNGTGGGGVADMGYQPVLIE